MSQRMAAEIWIGGRILVETVGDLCKAIAQQGVSLDWGAGRFEPTTVEELTEAVRPNPEGVPLLWLCHEEASWGQFEFLEGFLQGHEIPFTRRTEGCFEYPPERVEFRPGTGLTRLLTDDSGEPVVPAAGFVAIGTQLAQALQLARSGMAAQVETSLMSACEALRRLLPPEIPPLPPVILSTSPSPPGETSEEPDSGVLSPEATQEASLEAIHAEPEVDDQDTGELLPERSKRVSSRRHCFVLYDFDLRQLAATTVYNDRAEAEDDAADLQDVVVVPLSL